MNELIKIDDARPLADHWLRITFSDRAIKDVDVDDLLAAGGVFAVIASDRALFHRVNAQSRTIEWPGGVDLDPDVLYANAEPASGVRLRRRTPRERTVATPGT